LWARLPGWPVAPSGHSRFPEKKQKDPLVAVEDGRAAVQLSNGSDLGEHVGVVYFNFFSQSKDASPKSKAC
jgi:hypothetical protein